MTKAFILPNSKLKEKKSKLPLNSRFKEQNSKFSPPWHFCFFTFALS